MYLLGDDVTQQIHLRRHAEVRNGRSVVVLTCLSDLSCVYTVHGASHGAHLAYIKEKWIIDCVCEDSSKQVAQRSDWTVNQRAGTDGSYTTTTIYRDPVAPLQVRTT